MLKRQSWRVGAIGTLVVFCVLAASSAAIAVGAAPKVTSISPASGVVGASVKVTGTGFTGTTQVLFNGSASTFTVDSSTQITATVPAGATNGNIRAD